MPGFRKNMLSFDEYVSLGRGYRLGCKREWYSYCLQRTFEGASKWNEELVNPKKKM